MKHIQRASTIVFSICMFVICLFISLVSLTNSPKFFQSVWKQANTYEKMNISEEELTKVILHTMDYMWGKEDELQIVVTLNDGTTREFYRNYGEYNGKIMDELAHMEECRHMFLTGKALMIISCILSPIALFILIYTRKSLNYKTIRLSYYTYGAIGLIIGFIGILAVIDFETVFIGFHDIFFSNTNISYTFPSSSFMILMLPENELFANIVYRTLINFVLMFGCCVGLTIFYQHKLKSIQNKTHPSY